MNHFWIFDPETSELSRQEIQGDEIPARYSFNIGLIGCKLYIFGGKDESRKLRNALNDLFVVDLTPPSPSCSKLNHRTESPSPSFDNLSSSLDWVWEKKLYVLAFVDAG